MNKDDYELLKKLIQYCLNELDNGKARKSGSWFDVSYPSDGDDMMTLWSNERYIDYSVMDNTTIDYVNDNVWYYNTQLIIDVKSIDLSTEIDEATIFQLSTLYSDEVIYPLLLLLQLRAIAEERGFTSISLAHDIDVRREEITKLVEGYYGTL